jgi:hypothetical protein
VRKTAGIEENQTQANKCVVNTQTLRKKAYIARCTFDIATDVTGSIKPDVAIHKIRHGR